MKKILAVSLFVVFACKAVKDPNPHRFDEDMQNFKTIVTLDNVVVFTGSSSVRFWKDLQEDCPNMTTVNTGFGGSQTSDLLYFIDDAVLRFKPTKVYIYEGDNDIAEGKHPRTILRTTKKVTRKILAANPETEIYYISAKPSPSRWAYKKQYERFNTLLKNHCDKKEELNYLDIWTPMLGDNGRPIAEIFIEDSLHMNRKGYDIWKDVVCSSKY